MMRSSRACVGLYFHRMCSSFRKGDRIQYDGTVAAL
jgi:hypothetical protein